MRIGLVCVLLAGVALAGCAESEETDATLDDADPGSTARDTAGNVTNTAPVAELAASAVNGTAPLNVTFTINGTDADGDNLTWNLTVNGQEVHAGDQLPANVTHVFDEGVHNVTLRITDGQLSNTTTLRVGAEEAVAAFEPIVHETALELPCNQCYSTSEMDLCAGFRAGMQEIDCGWFDLPPEAAGRAYTTTSSGDDADIAFYSSCAPGNQIEFNGQAGHDEGNVPDGAGCVILTDWLIPGSTVSITIS